MSTARELLEETAAPPIERAAGQTQEELERVPKRRPPKDGLCRRCGQNRPVNRLMLCYPCWVKTELEAKGWRQGQPHPDWCHCEGLGAHPERLSTGN